MHNIPSPRPENDETHEQEIQRKGLTAPRVTPADIEAACLSEQFHVFPGTMLTVCCITLQNGFTVTGISACASPENFDQEIGERIARADAKQKIWPLLGYELRTKLHTEAMVDAYTNVRNQKITGFPSFDGTTIPDGAPIDNSSDD